MQNFLDILKKNKYSYMIAASLAVTIILINNIIDFADKIKENKLLLSLSLAISIKEEIWKNEK